MNIQCFFSISKHITLIGKPFSWRDRIRPLPPPHVRGGDHGHRSHRGGHGGRRGCQELPTRGIDFGGEGVNDEETFQRYKKGLHKTGGSACPEAYKDEPHQDRVGLLHSTKEDYVQQVFPVPRLRGPGCSMQWH